MGRKKLRRTRDSRMPVTTSSVSAKAPAPVEPETAAPSPRPETYFDMSALSGLITFHFLVFTWSKSLGTTCHFMGKTFRVMTMEGQSSMIAALRIVPFYGIIFHRIPPKEEMGVLNTFIIKVFDIRRDFHVNKHIGHVINGYGESYAKIYQIRMLGHSNQRQIALGRSRENDSFDDYLYLRAIMVPTPYQPIVDSAPGFYGPVAGAHWLGTWFPKDMTAKETHSRRHELTSFIKTYSMRAMNRPQIEQWMNQKCSVLKMMTIQQIDEHCDAVNAAMVCWDNTANEKTVDVHPAPEDPELPKQKDVPALPYEVWYRIFSFVGVEHKFHPQKIDFSEYLTS